MWVIQCWKKEGVGCGSCSIGERERSVRIVGNIVQEDENYGFWLMQGRRKECVDCG